MPMNMAVMALSPKEGFCVPALFSPPRDSRARYFLPNSVVRIMPHMMHTLIRKAMVEKASAVMASPLSVEPNCSAAAWATCVS